MEYKRENLEIAMDMLSCMLETGSVTRSEHPREFIRYDQDAEVRDALDLFTEKLGLLVCEYKDALYLSSGVNNRVLGFSNTEIKNELGKGFNNPEMYTAFFIMHVLVTEFYPAAVHETFRLKLSKDRLLESVETKVKAMAGLEDLESISEEYHFNFKTIYDLWTSLPKTEFKDDSDEIKQRGVGSKRTLVNETVKFMRKQGLVEEHDNAIYLTDRCKAIIAVAYNRSDVQSEISDFIDSLSLQEAREDA